MLPSPQAAAGWPRLVLYALAAAVALALTWFAIEQPPARYLAIDTIQHLSAARNLRDGHGLSTSVLYYQVHYDLGTIPAPQTVWPPGAALTAAALALPGLDLATAFVATSVAAIVLGAIALFLAMRTGGVRAPVAAPLAAVWLVSPSAWHFAVRGETEAPFVLFVCLALFASMRAAASAEAPRRWWFAAGLFAALAMLWRYQGAYLLPALLVTGIVSTWPRPLRERARALVLLMAAPVLVFAAIFGRNYALTGALTGVHGYVVDPLPLTGALKYAEWFAERSLAALLALDTSLFTRALLAGVAVLALTGVAGTLVAAWRAGGAEPERTGGASPTGTLAGALLAAGFVSTAGAHMFIGALTTATWYLAGVRYFTVLLPATLLLLALGIEYLLRSAPARRLAARSHRAGAVAAVVAWVPLAAITADGWSETRRIEPTVAGAEAVLASRTAGGMTVAEFLARDGGARWPMLASWAHEIHLLVGKPVVGLQPSSTSPTMWDAERALQLCDRLGLRSVLVADNHLAPPRDKYTANQVVLHDLAQGRVHPRFRLVLQTPDVRIFEVLPAPKPDDPGAVKAGD